MAGPPGSEGDRLSYVPGTTARAAPDGRGQHGRAWGTPSPSPEWVSAADCVRQDQQNDQRLAGAEAELTRHHERLGAGGKLKPVYLAGDHAHTRVVAGLSRKWFDRRLKDIREPATEGDKR